MDIDALFWIGQVVWLAFLACGAYVSFSFADLADENAARTVTPEKLLREFNPAAREGTVDSPSLDDGPRAAGVVAEELAARG